jgi:hypothetical protein
LILLTTAVVLLALVVVLHLVFTFGLVARIRELQTQGVPARESGMPKPGAVIAPFSVTDTDGDTITEADLDGPVRFGFFSVGCAPCHTVSDALMADPPAARFVSVVDGDPTDDETALLVAKLGVLGRVAVIGGDDPALAAFGVIAFPTLLHTHGGVITASGTKLSHFADVPTPVA